MNIADLRQEYMRAGLDERHADVDPFRQFEKWFDDVLAANLPLPNSMMLATATAQGKPSARAVLLKGIDHGGLVFFSNYASRKAQELEHNPYASLLFCWEELERQVRVEGHVKKIAARESDAYFVTRPLGSRLSAWASRQSEVVANREVLEARLADMTSRYGENPPRPSNWGGYKVVPESFEFWQGRPNRLHDRLLYTRHSRGWRIQRLAP